MIKWLDAGHVIALHTELLERWGGAEGGGHRGAGYEGVEAAVQAVKNSYYEAVEHLAAAYAVYIVQGHVFMDGNKRTGAASALVFLEVNGLEPEITPERLYRAMLELQERAERGERTEQLVEWLASLL